MQRYTNSNSKFNFVLSAFDVNVKERNESRISKKFFYPKFLKQIDNIILNDENDLHKLKTKVLEFKVLENKKYLKRRYNSFFFLLNLPFILIFISFLFLVGWFNFEKINGRIYIAFFGLFLNMLILLINFQIINVIFKKTKSFIKIYSLQQLYWILKNKSPIPTVYDQYIINIRNGSYCDSIYMLICRYFLKNHGLKNVDKQVFSSYALKEINFFGPAFVIIDKQIRPTPQLINFINKSAHDLDENSYFHYKDKKQLEELVHQWLNI